MMKPAKQIIVYLLIVYQIISHKAVFVIDYFQLIPLTDFIRRHDGTQSDPENLLPIEEIVTALIAMAMSTISFSFVMSILNQHHIFQTSFTFRSSALLSIWLHGLWAFHLLWKYNVWDDIMHPQSQNTPRFFLTTHLAWTITAFIILFLDDNTAINAKSNDKPIKKS